MVNEGWMNGQMDSWLDQWMVSGRWMMDGWGRWVVNHKWKDGGMDGCYLNKWMDGLIGPGQVDDGCVVEYQWGWVDGK